MKKAFFTLALTVVAFTSYAQTSSKGDVDGDGTISVTDVAWIVNHILGVGDDNFIAANADINGDGEIDINDVMATVCIILEGDNTQQAYLTCPDSNHPHLIDLGLPSGTLWKCCNEGASKPEDYGGYYQFGEVSSAPSLDQIKELVNRCNYTWTTLNGVSGGQFTGPNGGTIFLPAAGNVWYGELDNVGSYGLYWSSTPYNENDAYDLYFDSGRAYSSYGWRVDRVNEFSVRPVR